MAEADSPDAGKLATMALVTALLVIGVVYAVQVLYAATQQTLEHEINGGTPSRVVTYRQEQATRLDTYRWLDKPTGRVGLPVSRAMELTLVEANARRAAAVAPQTAPAGAPLPPKKP